MVKKIMIQESYNKQVVGTCKGMKTQPESIKGIPAATRSQEDMRVHYEPRFVQDTVKFNKGLSPKGSEAQRQTAGVGLVYKLIDGFQ